jgi:simple sugar transport system substrate-binding protein
LTQFSNTSIGALPSGWTNIMNTSISTLKFRFLTIAIGEEIFSVVRKGMEDAARAMGVEADLDGTPGVEAEELLRLTRKAIADGVDGIALNVIEQGVFDEVIAEAAAVSIPVVAFNIDAGKCSSGNLSYIVQDLKAAGEALGRKAAIFLQRGDKIIITLHDQGVWALEQRLAGIVAVLEPMGVEWKVVVTGQEPKKGALALREMLAAYPARALLGTGQGDTEACGLAAQSLPESALFVGGFDLSPGIVDLIDKGVIACSIDQQPYAQGFYPVVQLTLYLRYGLLPSSFDAGAAFIDRSNVETVRQLSRQAIR